MSWSKKFSVNAQRYDPYRNFKFRISWKDSSGTTKYVAAVNKIGALKRTTEVVEFREGGENSIVHKIPGKTKFEPIVVEAGLTQDLTFDDWASLVNNPHTDQAVSPKTFRKDVSIEVLNEQGQVALRYNVFNCWVSEYQAFSDLDANANAIAIKHLKLENEGFEKEMSAVELPET